MPFFPFSANWRDSYHVVYEFKTDIFTSRSGREQRRADRTTPRKQLQFTITLESGTALCRFVYRYQNSVVTIADRSRFVHASQIGPNQVTADSVPNWLSIGNQVSMAGVQRTVLGVFGNTVTVSGSDLDVHPNTAMFPVVSGRMNDNFPIKNVTDRVVEAAVTIALEPGSGPTDDEDSPQEVFNGREVFLFDPNWSTPIEGQFSRATDVVDFVRGVTQVYTPINFGARIKQIRVTFPTQRDRNEAVAFVHRMKGQRGEFYMPTWEDDLTVARPSAAETTRMWVRGREVFDTYANDTVYRAIVIRRRDGQQFYRRITSLMTDGVDTSLYTDVPWPIEIDSSVQVSWLLATRLATDTFDMECVTDEVGQAQFNTRSLEDLPVPDIANPWAGLSPGAQWLVDRYGWQFTLNVIVNPLHQWVHVDYPATASLIALNSGAYWLNLFYGQPYATTEVTAPLHKFMNITYPAYFLEN